jgi:hypothetical protein
MSPYRPSASPNASLGSCSLAYARKRARARKRSSGAAMFIVAVTLGLLAAMGVYGLSATAYDVRAAGHAREATQAQHAAEEGVIMTAETLQPGTAGEIVRAMQADKASALRKSACKTAKPLSSDATQAAEARAAEACFILSPKEMEKLSPIKSPAWEPPFRAKTSSTPGAFGEVDLYPFVRVELTNPIDWATPAGYGVGAPNAPSPIFTQVRATVFVELKPGTDATDALEKHPAELVATGRGRLIVGPYTQ